MRQIEWLPGIRWASSSAWARRAAWAVAAVLALWALLWAAVPPLAKWQIEQRGSDALGRALTVEAIEFAPWSLEITLRGVRLAGLAGQPPQLSVARVYADLELESLLRLAPVVDALHIEQPRLRLAHRGQGRYDIDDIVLRLARKDGAPAGEPARFALFNLLVRDGALRFDDQAVGRVHEVQGLTLAAPFLSNLPSQRQIKVQPHLAFTLNGSRFDSDAQGTPFAQTRQGEATLELIGLDVAPYLGYLPRTLPVTLRAAVLDAKLRVAFEQTQAAPAVRISGELRARDVVTTTPDGSPLLSLQQLVLGLDDVRPLERRIGLRSVELQAPMLQLRRRADGRLNIAGAVDAPTAPTTAAASTAATAPITPTAPIASGAPSASSPSGTTPSHAATASVPWQISLARLDVSAGQVRWHDEQTRPAAQLALQGIALQLRDLAWPAEPGRTAALSASATLASPTAGGTATLQLDGQVHPQTATLQWQIQDLPLAIARPYMATVLEPALSGKLAAQGQLQWSTPAPQQPAGQTLLTISDARLDRLLLGDAARPEASLGQLSVANTRIDLIGQRVEVGLLALRQPRLDISRDEQGRWMAQRWLRAPPANEKAQASGTQTPTAKPWQLSLAELRVDDGQFGLQDRAAARPVALELKALKLQLRGLALDSVTLAPPPGTAPATLSLNSLVAVPGEAAAPGTLAWRGTLVPMPLALQGQLDAQRLPLHALAPYGAAQFNLELQRALGHYTGQVEMRQSGAGTQLRLAGDVRLDELQATTRPTTGSADAGGELLAWRSLALSGLRLALRPGSATTLDVAQTSLTDYFARIQISEQGRLNLQGLVRTAADGTATTAAAPSASASPSPSPVIRMGPVLFQNGRVAFSDRFVKPNYAANLSELSGRLSAFASAPAGGSATLAELQLNGKVEGSAQLDISGTLNPLAKPLQLDIRARMRELELAPLTPYSVKYAGHGIERGKLSMDVRYEVLPNGQLTASNRLVLNQLQFSDKVDGAPASLPVRLAVALLADRNGVIDLDLPISGSLNDPQFRLAPLIFKIIGNLIVRAVTAPFSLLAGALGGGAGGALAGDMSQVPFAPGTATLGDDARARLDQVARALVERTGLRITVVGSASLQAEREAIQRETVRGWVLAEKRRAAGGAVQLTSVGAGASAGAAVTAAEYPTLLRAVYGRAEQIKKPRNAIGIVRDMPVAEMESLLLASVNVGEPQVRELALARGLAVKDYLLSRQLDAARLFLGAPRLAEAAGVAAATSADKPSAPGPRADLLLDTR